MNRSNRIESLETRRLLSSAAILTSGQLLIEGSNDRDVVTVGLNAAGDKLNVLANGQVTQSFATTSVKTITFRGNNGADEFTVDQSNGVLNASVRFFGGRGDDIFKGGTENDVARGEGGNDILVLGEGRNLTDGGAGSDILIGGDNHDTIVGSLGNDTIDAGQGHNVFERGTSGSSDVPVAMRAANDESDDFSARTTVFVIYNGINNATIVNPFEDSGVVVTANGGAVAVTATPLRKTIQYQLLGTSAAGSFSMSSTKPTTFLLNNLDLTNPSGAAINITGGRGHSFLTAAGTTNSLADGAASTKNGALQTDGQIGLAGSGSLSIRGVKKHAVSTTGSISVLASNIRVEQAASDGFHSEGFLMSGGTLTIAASAGDGVDAGDGAVAISGGTLTVNSTAQDVKALKTGNNTVDITGGALKLNVAGNASKAISAKGAITITDGNFDIDLAGAAVLTAAGTGFDPSYATGIKSDAAINITGGTFAIDAAATATGAKGISSDTDVNISSGTFTFSTAAPTVAYINETGASDTYSSASITADNDITVTGGALGITATGSGNRGLSADADVVFAGGNATIALSGATFLNASGSGSNTTYPTGIKADGNIDLSSGSITVTGTSAATGARGLSADGTISVTGGSANITLAGNGANYINASGVADSYAAAAFSSDTALSITGGTVTTTSSGTGGKGLKSDGTITIGSATGSPTLNITTTGNRFLTSGSDYNHPKTLVATGAISIVNGTNTFRSTDDGIHSDTSITISGGNTTVVAQSATQGVGEGVEAPIINLTGGVTNVTASNDGINATYGTVVGGTENPDGSQLNISGGVLIVAGSDAIDSNGNITITGGTTIVDGPATSPEEGIDYNGTFLMNGGFLMAGGSASGMTKAMSAASTQTSLFLKSSAAVTPASLLHIRDAAGNEIVTFKPKNNAYYFHVSTASLARGTSYSVYFGGTYTGGSYVGNNATWGVLTGGTYSLTGATLKRTFTTSTTASVNTQTF